ncbi:MAG: site-specific DNA-methyltransferase, partial [Candidatus Hydrogenedentes bacterium]|nr:site-specific DNA-methyltransferase [Candidatus Hydrogenedentota bacterium]
MKSKRSTPSTGKDKGVAATRHKDKRKNIPTRELQRFVAEDENSPKTLLYPRDPSLDPQLVWKGKDEQDRHPLELPLVPVYIQEKVHPQALIENLRRQQQPRPGQQQDLDLYADFNGIAFEDLIDFYHHEQNWSNRMILGDSLLVMASLAEKEGLKGKVQMIYLDPPYGIKFGSNWQVSTRKRDVKDGKSEDSTRQPEQIRAFRDTWKLGIHSYLGYLRDRFTASRDLLTDSGSIFVQIGDENVHLVRSVMDEVFGNTNFQLSVVVKKKSATTITDPINDYLLWYSKSRDAAKIRRIWAMKDAFADRSRFKFVEFSDGTRKRLIECTEAELQLKGVRFLNDDYPLVSQDESEGRTVPYVFADGSRAIPGSGRHWTYDPIEGMRKLAFAGRLRTA